MKATHLAYGFIGALLVLTSSERSWSGFDDDGYVQTDESGKPVVPTPHVRQRKMPKAPKAEGVASNPAGNQPKPKREHTKNPTRVITHEADEVRTARLEQRAKDAETKSKVREALRLLNNLRLKNGEGTMSGDGCKNDVCRFSYKEAGRKVSCSGSIESFLIDESPGFTCGDSVCFLNKSTGRMDCNSKNSPVAGGSTPAPMPPYRNPAGVPGNPNCFFDEATGLVKCPGPHDPRREHPGVRDAI